MLGWRTVLGGVMLGAAALTVAALGCSTDLSEMFQPGGGGGATGGHGVGGSGGGTGGESTGGSSPCGSCDLAKVCHPSQGCVDCLIDEDCVDPGKPRCSPLYQCVECADNGDCTGGEVCYPAKGECGPSCESDQDCLDSGKDKAKQCDDNTGICYECLEPGDCPPDKICNPAVGKCVRCIYDTDCSQGEPRCKLPGGDCVECLVIPDCQPGEICVLNTCVQP